MDRLYDADHPYYCAEAQPVTEYWAWDHFIEDFGDSDPDLNLVVRWDWWRREDPDEESPPEYLELAILHQRKGLWAMIRVAVKRDEEPEIREWLTERHKTIAAIWEPIA